MNLSFLRLAIVLGLLSAMGPFAIDMYLPALPALGQSLHATPAAVQHSLMAFFLSVGVCQLLYGPLSDMLGRKRPLYAGLGLFAVTSVACAFATNIETLIVLRFAQGIGACSAMVIPRAIVRDLYTGPDAARLMSLLMLVFSVSPLLAPLAGSAAIAWASWRAVFWAVALLAVLGLLLAVLLLPETRPEEQRLDSTVRKAWQGYLSLLCDGRFLGLCFVGGFGMSAFFVYLANSSFVLIDHYGLSPTVYSLFFSINAVAFIGTAQLTGYLTARFGLLQVVRVAATGHAATLALLGLLWYLGLGSLGLLATLLFVGFGFLGLVIPTTTVLALDDHGPIAGTAAALMGTLQMVTGALVVSLIGLWVDGTPWPMVVGITGSALVTVSLAWATLSQTAPALKPSIEAEA
ncbi:MAG: Bcr/CflA family drug resistance efflux transporter [Myxococcaceae bacterium]|nr:Bcr/CflA family drug resistance efflux transporter [Myxococcaceae bacterium]